MRTSVTVCVLGAVGALVGGWLVGRWCLGVVLIAESAAAIGWGVFGHDFPGPVAREIPGQGSTLAQILERSRVS